jgi:DNA topoisomerase I
MKLIVTEKNQTAQRIASILSEGKNSSQKSPGSTVYSYKEGDEEVKVVGMRGHVLQVDFPEEYRVWQQVEPRDLVDAEIEKTPKVKSLVNTLKKLAREADSVVIATDYDREGELIGADIKGLIIQVNPDVDISRARFSALTPIEITQAFSNLEKLDENLASAGEARQDIDLIWGAALTRFISLATMRLGQKFLSAGRVQSPTLAILVDREKEIKAFVPEKFWQVKVTCERHGESFPARHKTERFDKEEDARAAFDKLGEEGVVSGVTTKDRSMNPPAPFNTTSFLAAASGLKIHPARAMDIAESLYTRGIISYPRVDNTVYPESLDLAGVLQSIKGADIVGQLAGELLQKKELKPTRGKKFSTDHPPLYPTASASKASLKPAEWRIYELVARRFMATLADSAAARSTRVDIDINGEPFVARGDVIVSEGFLRYYPYSRKRDEELPALEDGDRLKITDSQIDERQTQPPSRFSEGRLIEKMEELGLGTKSTRHSIIQSLLERGYAFGSPLRPTETGTAVTQSLERHATLVTTPDMTSQLEQDMDLIVEGRQSLEGVVGSSRKVLGEVLEIMEREKEDISREIREGVRGDSVLGECPGCGGEMRILKAKKSGKRFVGCGSYPECTRTYPLPQKGAIVSSGEACDECGSPRIKVLSKGSKPWEICLDPECPTKSSGKKAADSQEKSQAED